MADANFSASPEFVRDLIDLAIKHKKQIKIWYVDQKGQSAPRVVEPLEVANEKNFSAWCTLRNNFRHFSFDRVVRVFVTDVNRTFVEEEKKQEVIVP